MLPAVCWLNEFVWTTGMMMLIVLDQFLVFFLVVLLIAGTVASLSPQKFPKVALLQWDLQEANKNISMWIERSMRFARESLRRFSTG
jgi:hypothetical protein